MRPDVDIDPSLALRGQTRVPQGVAARLPFHFLLPVGLALLCSCAGTSVKVFNETVVPGSATKPSLALAPRPLRYGGGIPLRSMNPNLGGWNEASAMVHARLFTFGTDGRLQPDLVQTSEFRDDGRTLHVTLRPAIFHHGAPVTAADVRASLSSLESQGELRRLLGSISEVRVLDELTFELVLSAPDPELPEALTELAILHKGQESVGDRVVGAGPFRLVQQGATWAEFEAHDLYHQGPPKCRAVDLRIVEDDRDRARALVRGELDLACLKPESLHQVADRERFRIHRFQSGAVRSIPLNVRAPGLDDPRVRQALSALVDRDAVVQEILGTAGRPAYQVLAPTNVAFHHGLDRPSRGLKEAMGLFEKAGYRQSPDGFYRREGQTLVVRVVAWQGESFRRRAAERIVRDWRTSGIDASVIPVDHATYQRLADHLGSEAEAFVGGYGGGSMPATVLKRKFASDGGQNRGGFSDPILDQAFRDLERETVLGPRVSRIHAVLERLDELTPWIPLASVDVLFASTSRVRLGDIRTVDSWYEFPRFLWQVEVSDDS